jgi:raffinose/stachyose/melibiose transport system substrate-binding protein
MLSTSRGKSRLRSFAAIAIAGLAALSLAACSSGGSTSSGSATSGTVEWWGWTPQPNAATAYIAAFNKVYPKIKVTYKQLTIDGWNAALRPALASNVGPDVYDIAPGAGLAEFGGSAIDLTSAIKAALGSDWKSKVAPIGIKGLTTSGGKLAALSVGSTFAGPLWINKDMFTKYNVTPPTTLSEWAKDCATFASHGVGCFVQGAGQVAFNQDTLQAITDSIEPGLWTKASTGEAKWTNPAIVKALTIWKQLFTDKIMQEGALGTQQYPDADNDFLSGKFAMVMMGTWYMQYATTAGMVPAISAAGVANPVPYPIVPIPFPNVAGSGHSGGALFGDSDYGLAVNSKSKDKAAATTFVTWLTTSTAGQQQVANALNDIPALNSVKPQWDSIKMPDKSVQQAPIQDLIKEAGSVSEPRLSTISANLQTAIGVASTTVAAGQATPEQAAATLQTSAVAAGEKFK